MAKLISGSDARELQEIVARWIAEAPTESIRHQYEVFGQKLLDLKRALEASKAVPSEEELTLALTMMLRLAQSADPSTTK